MCHFLLLLPLLSLPVFWILPFGPALAIYGTLLVVSAGIYWYAIQAMRRPVQTGVEAMVGETGVVIESRGGKNLFVRACSEIWHAECASQLREGDRLKVVAVEDLTLRVKKLEVTPNDGLSNLPTPTADGESDKSKGGAMTVAMQLRGTAFSWVVGSRRHNRKIPTLERHAKRRF